MMVQLLKPQEVKVLTKDGECQVSIVLELNINLNNDNIQTIIKEKKEKGKKKEKDIWEIPDFFSTEKIDFGKQEIKE